jgi:2,3-diketo-5-methylthio-1-phosphopentane phosphatase
MGDISSSSTQLPRFIFFTDFDGTVTQQDSNDFMTDNIGFGPEQRLADNNAVLYGQRAFRDSFREMMDSVTKPFDQCIEYLLDNITPDPYFAEFIAWCRTNDIPVLVLSGGMEPIIRALLDRFLPDEEVKNLKIVSNQVKARPGKSINEEGGWAIEFHDDR